MKPLPLRFLFLIIDLLLYDSTNARDEQSWSQRYFGYEYAVVQTNTHFNGSGGLYSIGKWSGQPTSDGPSVTTKMIQDVLFPSSDSRFPSTQIFRYDKAEMRWRYDEWQKIQKMKESNGMVGAVDTNPPLVVRVKEEKLAVVVGQMLFFWGEGNMPQGRLLRFCHSIDSANYPDQIRLCVDWSLERCKRTIEDILAAPVLVNYSIPSQLAWLCPARTRCCEWECCAYELTDELKFVQPDLEFHVTVNTFLMWVIIIIVACCAYWRRRNREVARPVNSSRSQEREEEIQPLVVNSGCPRQPTAASITPVQPAAGDIGWKTSAPPGYDEAAGQAV